MAEIKMIALDLDGTLFNSRSVISDKNKEAIRYAAEKGGHVVISTGRPLEGLPFAQILDLPIDYALTNNGAAAYRLHGDSVDAAECIFEDTIPDSVALPLLQELLETKTHQTIFAAGRGVSPTSCIPMIPALLMPDTMKKTYVTIRKHVDDVYGYIVENGLHITKITLNFIRDEHGELIERDMLEKKLSAMDELSVCCGGFMNLEITAKGITKGRGLLLLADRLGITQEETMAMGDAGNDLSIIEAAGVGVCMENGEAACKAVADYITATNDQDGVAQAIYKFVF